MRSEIAKSRAARVIERIEAGGSKIMDSLLDTLDALAAIAFASQGAIRAAEINLLIVTRNGCIGVDALIERAGRCQ